MIPNIKLKEKKLIHQLSIDSRQPLSKLAKEILTNKQLIHYKINWLQKKGFIKGFYTLIDVAKLGYNYYLLYLKFENIPNEKLNEFHESLIRKPRIVVNVSTLGGYDACIVFLANSAWDFEQCSQKYLEDYEQYIKEKTICIETSANYLLGRNVLSPDSNIKIIKIDGKITNKIKDNKDIEILNLLSQNARIPLIKISENLKLSPNTIKERIKRMKKDEIIKGFTVQINFEEIGYSHYRLFFNLQKLTNKRENEIITFLLSQPNMISVSKTIGPYTLECRIVINKISEIYELSKKMKNLFEDNFKSYEILQYYKFYEVLNYLPRIN